MTTDRKKANIKGKRLRNLVMVLVILLIIIGLPWIFLKIQSSNSGLTVGEVLQRKLGNSEANTDPSTMELADAPSGEKLDFLDPVSIGFPFSDPPMISHLVADDLDGDGLLDVLVCDAKDNFVSWIRQAPDGSFTERVLASDLIAPAHVEAIDFEGDGDKDLMVAVLGLLYPSNDRIGSVVVLENDGEFNFRPHTIISHIARVSDVRAGDLDGDGDMDLAVAQFGYDDGETRWMENLGNWEFRTHMLQNLSGPINVELTDIDGARDLDIFSLVSQEWGEIYCYSKDGRGEFRMKLVWGSDNEDFGSSGISLDDVNQDGLVDILYANGDAFDYIPPQGRPWHGLQWLENKGGLVFEFHRVATLVGAYSLKATDIDNDGDKDLFAVSAFNLWEDLSAQSFIWLENTGEMNFI